MSPRFSEDEDYSFFDIRSFCDSHRTRQVDLQTLKEGMLAEPKLGKHFIPGGAFEHRIGSVVLGPDRTVVITSPAAEDGWLAFGPAEPLKRGKYRATFEFANVHNSDGRTMDIDINVHGHATRIVLNSLSFVPESPDGVVSRSLVFTVSNPLYTSFDYRVRKDAGIGLDFLGVRVERLDGKLAEPH
jgi:hypothetical protein